MNLFELQREWDGHADPGDDVEEVKDPSELTEDEAEARQTGVPVEEVVAKKKTKKPAKKAEKPAKKPAAKKAKSAKVKAPAKKTAAKKSAKKSAYVRKGEKNGKPSNRGPKGNKTPKRSAKDGGVFGRKADRARKEKGWSQAHLAERSGLTQPGICNILRGTAGASEAAQKRISKALGLK